jgi:FkbM family methyltransferase
MRLKSAARRTTAAILRQLVVPGRYRLFRLAQSVLGTEPGRVVVPLRGGGKLLIDGDVDSYTYYLGDFEWRVQHVLCRMALGARTVFDVGSNCGFYTIPLALRVGPRGRVYAFEALRPNYELLLENIALNGLTNVIAVYGAVTDKTGVMRVPDLAERSNYSLATRSEREAEIPSWSLDDFIAREGIPSVDLLKLDIEGSEVIAVRGAWKSLKNGVVKTVVCEFNPYWLAKMGSNLNELYELFESLRLELSLITRTGRLRRINREFVCNATSEFDVVLQPRRNA